jgi:hypothetical protein
VCVVAARSGPRFVIASLAAAILLVSGADVAEAVPAVSSTRTYQVRGVEYAATSAVGSFAGIPRLPGQEPAGFNAVVAHTLLHPNATITSGAFTIFAEARVDGQLTGGSITLLDGGTGCVNQHYAVNGQLATSEGPGRFQVTLTHYQRTFGTHCVTYFATIEGSATVPASSAAPRSSGADQLHRLHR